ncbi:hypothetical protein [Pseudoduganella violacea]|uniref:Uncharacterized protein n=1 Tax=Pseudoduganella violacea TaxID=1715466 RepID=A0A7W5B8M9_9BURK|nr:hypothetical protein [Pseudoduganella violacea]MBB3118561.1 hypothetical protein [Pseudoduganella violacea]
MSTVHPATAAGLESLADQFSACADALHSRLMSALRQPLPQDADGSPAPPPAGTLPAGGKEAPPLSQGITRGAAQLLFDTEVTLRQRANSLYVEAAQLSVSGLALPQQDLLGLVAQARTRIARIEQLKELAATAASLVALAAAIVAARPQDLPAAFKELQGHLARQPATAAKTGA